VPESLICFNLVPELELELIDWLLSRPDVDGFTSVPCFGHGQQHQLQNIAEHVSGKARRVQIQVKLEDAMRPSLLAALGAEFPGADVLYWVLPVLCSGDLNGVIIDNAGIAG
jgi:hypothetical protein